MKEIALRLRRHPKAPGWLVEPTTNPAQRNPHGVRFLRERGVHYPDLDDPGTWCALLALLYTTGRVRAILTPTCPGPIESPRILVDLDGVRPIPGETVGLAVATALLRVWDLPVVDPLS